MQAEDKPALDMPVPRAVVIGLVLINLALALKPLFGGFSGELLQAAAYGLFQQFVMVPAWCVAGGLVLKLLDRRFKLSNAYLIGLIAAIAFAIRAMRG
ncbi:hypothetical protein GCM10007907_35430 [Chitinimonas prasina]|uniref:Uncharacterized protein n=1 Tax=Chitinimonas prasina TaxID=1434937 RepID=A0ABQ5YM26_9NEIS|nr:hypothetical protein [Chitinimonas prasina]GLR14753.1 hypothetical protein GCM10007907_35430 [Chitinimonas prasina]